MEVPSKRLFPLRGPLSAGDLLVTVFLIFFPLLAVPSASLSQDTIFKCGDGNVSLGDSKVQVLSTCGKPDWSDLSGTRETGSRDTDETGRAKYRKDTVKVEKWYYNRGYGDFIYTLTFEGDTLKAIEKAGRGR